MPKERGIYQNTEAPKVSWGLVGSRARKEMHLLPETSPKGEREGDKCPAFTLPLAVNIPDLGPPIVRTWKTAYKGESVSSLSVLISSLGFPVSSLVRSDVTSQIW